MKISLDMKKVGRIVEKLGRAPGNTAGGVVGLDYGFLCILQHDCRVVDVGSKKLT